VLTSREQPLRAVEGAVRTLRLGGLGVADAQALLASHHLGGDAVAWRLLVERYGGNPLALGVVGETIDVVFAGDVATFLAQEAVVFGGIRELLDEQAARLSALGRSVLAWLAVEREPVGFAELAADLGPGVARTHLVEAVEGLRRCSLLETLGEASVAVAAASFPAASVRGRIREAGGRGTFTLQPVVLEYATAELVGQAYQEVMAGEPALLVSHALVKAQSKDYVRRSQERLIALPLLERLRTSSDRVVVEQRLLALLQAWRGRPTGEQGYGPGNVVNLLRLLRGDLRRLDLSRLGLRQAYLQGVDAQDASLAGAHLAEAVLAEALAYPTAVALSVDGAFLVAGTPRGEVHLWRAADRTLLLAVQGHSGAVWGVALSGDGRLLASGSFDGTIKLWEVGSGRLLATLQGHTGAVYGVALSGDGRLVASGSEYGTIKLWEAGSGQLLATLEGHSGAVWGVALSGGGRLLASGGQDGMVRLWEVEGGRPLATLQGHTGLVYGVALSEDGRLLASGGVDGTVRLWEVESGRPLATMRGHTGLVRGVALSEDGRLLASGGVDGTVRLWEVPSGQPVATLQGHTGMVRGVALSWDARLLASGGQDGTVGLWEVGSGRLLTTLQGHTAVVRGVALSGDGRLLASGSENGAIKLWEAESGQLLTTLQGHTAVVRSVALSGNGRLLASGGQDGTVKLWEADGGRLLATLQGHTGAVYGVVLSGNGRLVASCSEDGAVKLWEARSTQLLATLQGHTGIVFGVALSGDGQLLASGGVDGTVKLWEADGGRLLATLQGHSGIVLSVALSADGRLLASGGVDGTVRLWEVGSGQLLATLQGHTGLVRGVALSVDGLLASGSWDGTVRLWETGSGQLLATLQDHTGGVYSVALSGDGRLLASGGDDGTVKLWEAGSGVCLRTLRADRRYERLDITGLTGVTKAQRSALLALGALDGEMAPDMTATPVQVSSPHAPAAAVVSVPPPEPEPSPPAPDRPPTNVRTPRTPFVGRSADLAALTLALDPAARAGTRLLTLTGMAGSGKTRLALQVAEARRDAYQGGVWLVELSPLPASAVADLTPVVAATLAALDLHEQEGQTILDTLIAHFRSRRILLVLDNCEHVVAAAAALAARLLDMCPELRIFATSQQALGHAGEIVWPVAPLAVPPQPTDALTAEEVHLLAQSDAVQLFVQRAQAAQPGFTLTPQNAATVAAICRWLDGLPLAIELAAARVNVLSVEDLLARLDDRFQLLRRGGRTADQRHQALQATMDWSYGLLDGVEQAVLRRIAVFMGGWEVAAAEAVSAGEEVEAEAVLDALDTLLERSLVYVHRADETPRYGLLETVRLYGVQQLEQAGETVAVRDRHLAWCAALAEQATSALQGPEQVAWLARLGCEHDNLRVALQWALDHGRSTLGLRVAGGLGKFWLRGGYQREGRSWLEALLALAADAEDHTAVAARATAIEAAAWLADDRHDFAQAAALFAQSRALRRTLGEEEGHAGTLITEGLAARAAGDYPRATALLEECLAQTRRFGRRERTQEGDLGFALSWGNRYTLLALVLREQGEYGRASTLCEECLALARERGDAEGIGLALLSLGDVARDQGDAARVRMLCAESLARYRELGQNWAIGFSLNNLALAAYLEGDLALAARYAAASEALFREPEAETSLAEVLITLGRVREAQGEPAAAWASLAEALTLAWAKGPRLFVAAALEEMGVQTVRHRQARHGVHLLAATATLRQAMGTPVRQADRPSIERALATARTTLGEASFTNAWATGETLPLEEAIALALEGHADGN
jgi:WD40 repeat protein/predicted ATPase